ncbi:MAG: hypothetical protein KDD61_16890 [Bdellovibrionales bacterium]|nr:hypothetical protein [Bdellovibrionales bacterium]
MFNRSLVFVIWILVSCFYSFRLEARITGLDPESIDIEIMNCSDGYHSLTEFEYTYIFGKPNPYLKQFNYKKHLIGALSLVSPVRSSAMVRFRDEIWPTLTQIPSGRLRQKTLSSAQFSRSDCKLEIVANMTIDEFERVQGALNVGLWNKLKPETQNFVLAEAYFYFESIAWQLKVSHPFFKHISWSPVSGRYFISALVTPKFRPNGIAEFNSLVVKLQLAFVEQYGVVIPIRDQIDWNSQTGLVEKSYGDYSTKVWTSNLTVFNGQQLLRIPFAGWYKVSGETTFIDFNENGTLHCIPQHKSVPIVNFAISLNGDLHYWSDKICFYGNGQIESGTLVIPENTVVTWMFQGNVIVSGQQNGENWIQFYPGGSVRQILYSKGQFAVNDRLEVFRGPLYFQPVRSEGQTTQYRLHCGSPPKGSRWIDQKGRRLEVTEEYQIFCFDDRGRVEYYCNRPCVNTYFIEYGYRWFIF